MKETGPEDTTESNPSLAARAQLELRYSQVGFDPKKATASHKGTLVDPSLDPMHEVATVDVSPGTSDTLGAPDADVPAGLRQDGEASTKGLRQDGEASTKGLRQDGEASTKGLRQDGEASTKGLVVRAARHASLPVMRASDAFEIVLGPIVGTGGMGIVNVADQPSLRREVAVKRVRPERQNTSTVNSLLREAWVTGTLEHPNIVPIHLLLDAATSPRVVMKRIEGVTWDALLEAPELLTEFGGHRRAADQDGLLFHLRILGEVCQAIHFAHSRGVLHLDLKPENVMVGRFGEVYVVDWGIAASLPGIGPDWLPQASRIRTVRGTPSWMPPELATADGTRVGVHSDVYLLGSLLHAVLTGNAQRHEGGEMIDLLAAAYESRPVAYGPKVPTELAALANRATARDPSDRPESASVFRRAIEDYLEHRHSTELEARATAGKDALVAFFARAHKGIAEGTHVGQGLRRDFLECRFAFRQALEIWPGNEKAKAGLQEVLRAMANFALANDQLERAAESVAELSPPDPALEQRLRALRQDLAQRHQRLLELERDASIDTFREKRSLMALGTGLLFIIWNIVCGLLHRSGTFVFEVTDLLWFNAMTIALFSGAAWIVRKSLLTTATNRRLVVLFGSGFIAVLTFWFAAWLHGTQHPERALGTLEIVALSNWSYSFFALAVAFTMDIRGAWVAIPVTIIALLAPLAETYAFELLGLEGFLCGSWLAFIWRSDAPRRDPFASSSGTHRPP